VGKGRIGGLEPVVHADGVTALGLARGRGQWERAEEGDVFFCKRRGEEGRDCEDLIGEKRVQGQILEIGER